MSKKSNNLNTLQVKKKKISFFSAILVVMGSSIGAGIFFRSEQVLNNSQNSLVLAIFSWLIAAFSVIAMGLALVEISSVRNDNLSILGWTKEFNTRKTFKASKNFMLYLYLPINLFYMPLYLIMTLQDGIGSLIHQDSSPFIFNTNVDWLLWTLISIGISIYFMCVSGLSSKAGNIQNKIFMYIKFLPLGFVAVVGFVLVGMNMGGWNKVQIGFSDYGNFMDFIKEGNQLSKFFPSIGLCLSVSAIFFTYDGFYVAAGIQSEMENPKKTPMAILTGLVVVTSIYLIIAISMSINGGSFSQMQEFMKKAWGNNVGRILYGIVNILIAIGILSIINSYAIWMPRYAESLIKEGEVPFTFKYRFKLNDNKPKIGVIYYIILTIPLVLVFSIIGSLSYINSYNKNYGQGMGRLYTFADLIATWMSMIVFVFIVAAIFGGIVNRKTNRIKTKKTSYFLPMAWISCIVIGFTSLITILMPFIDLIMIAFLDKQSIISFNPNNSYEDIIIGRIMLVVTLFIIVSFIYGIRFIEDKIHIRKYGSIEKYEQWQKAHFDVS